jgi:hypothetical protein
MIDDVYSEESIPRVDYYVGVGVVSIRAMLLA